MSLAFNHSILSNAVMPHHWFWWCHHLLLLSLSLPYPTSIFTTHSSKLHHLSSSSYVLLYFNLFLSCSYSYSYYLHNLFLSPLPSQPLPLSTSFTTSSSLHYLHNLFLSPLPSQPLPLSTSFTIHSSTHLLVERDTRKLCTSWQHPIRKEGDCVHRCELPWKHPNLSVEKQTAVLHSKYEFHINTIISWFFLSG